MSIITLTSDWGYRDSYLGAVKGAILKQIPGAVIVDVTHEVAKYNFRQAAFIIRNFYNDFPEGTIHLIGVMTEESDEYPHIVARYKGQYFIGADTGVFALIFDEAPEEIILLDIHLDTNYLTFSTRDRFVKAAAHIAAGKPLNELGYPRETLTHRMTLQPTVEGNSIRGNVIYVDSYGNAISNINESLFREIGQKRKFSLSFRGHRPEPIKESRSYGDMPEGEIVVLFGTHGFLEVAVNLGKAKDLLGLDIDAIVVITFND